MANVVTTGSARGIGLELCRQLAARGDRVFATCRRRTAALEALDVTIVETIDVALDEAMPRLVAAVDAPHIDVVIHAAGAFAPATLDELDFVAMQEEYEVNALGALRVVRALLPRLVGGSKIALLSSRVGSITDNAIGGMYGYRMSKCALNMATVCLAHELHDRAVAVVALHPGMVDTELHARAWAAITRDPSTPPPLGVAPSIAAAALLERIDALTLAQSGTFVNTGGEPLPW